MLPESRKKEVKTSNLSTESKTSASQSESAKENSVNKVSGNKDEPPTSFLLLYETLRMSDETSAKYKEEVQALLDIRKLICSDDEEMVYNLNWGFTKGFAMASVQAKQLENENASPTPGGSQTGETTSLGVEHEASGEQEVFIGSSYSVDAYADFQASRGKKDPDSDDQAISKTQASSASDKPGGNSSGATNSFKYQDTTSNAASTGISKDQETTNNIASAGGSKDQGTTSNTDHSKDQVTTSNTSTNIFKDQAIVCDTNSTDGSDSSSPALSPVVSPRTNRVKYRSALNPNNIAALPGRKLRLKSHPHLAAGYTCFQCIEPGPPAALGVCTKCRWATYCSPECLGNNRQEHKYRCRHMKITHIMMENIPEYIYTLALREDLRVVDSFKEVPDTLQEAPGKNVALVVRIADRAPCSNGSTFAYYIMDRHANVNLLHIYQPPDTRYYLHDSCVGYKVKPPSYLLQEALRPGLYVVIFQAMWCLFVDGPGLRVDSLTRLYILPDPGTVIAQIKEHEKKKREKMEKRAARKAGLRGGGKGKRKVGVREAERRRDRKLQKMNADLFNAQAEIRKVEGSGSSQILAKGRLESVQQDRSKDTAKSANSVPGNDKIKRLHRAKRNTSNTDFETESESESECLPERRGCMLTRRQAKEVVTAMGEEVGAVGGVDDEEKNVGRVKDDDDEDDVKEKTKKSPKLPPRRNEKKKKKSKKGRW